MVIKLKETIFERYACGSVFDSLNADKLFDVSKRVDHVLNKRFVHPAFEITHPECTRAVCSCVIHFYYKYRQISINHDPPKVTQESLLELRFDTSGIIFYD